MFDWDDLRHFLSAARAGSLTAAAQKLGVDAATVGRRLARLETALGATLFVRSPSGLQLTATGGRLLETAQGAEAAMEAAARATARDTASGTVRISVSEGFGTAILAPALPELRRARPHLRIELAAQTVLLSPTKREADIAITLAAPSAQRLVVEPLTDYELGLYASSAYLRSAGAPQRAEDLRAHAVIGYVDDLLQTPELLYLDEILPGLRPTLSSSSIRAQRAMIEADGGIGVLPCFMAEGLSRVLPREARLKRRFWLSTHKEAGDTARVRAVRDWLKALVRNVESRLNPTY